MARENHPFMLFILLRRLKIVDRLDSADDLGGRLDVLNDLVHALVRHRRLVKGIGDDAGGVDTRHLRLILCHSKTLEGGRTGHQTSRAVRCRTIPILVTLTNADERAITHIDGNEQLLASLGRYCTLSEYHLIHVYVVVNGLESLN